MPSSIPNETNSLAAMYPDVARQLDPSLNNGITADMVCAGSKRPITWRCEKDPSHTWISSVHNRTGKGTGCNICGGKVVDPRHSLHVLRPDVALYWHPTLNGSLHPEDVSCGSQKTVVWICRLNKSHTYKTKIHVRCRSYGECRTCRGWYVTDDNRLSIKFPEIAAELHPTKNRMLYPASKDNASWFPKNHFRPGEEPKRNRRITPADIPMNSKEIFVWQGSCGVGHEWKDSAYDRTHGIGCGVCHGNRNLPALDNSLASMFRGVAKMFHPTKNGSLTPSQIRPFSTKKRWFRCFRHADHDFEATVASVVRSWKAGANGCPTCKGLKVLYRDSLAAKYPKVAAMMRAAKSEIDPKTVRPRSNKESTFQCPRVAYHLFTAQIDAVVRAAQKGNSGCGYCRGSRLHPLDSLKEKYPEVARYIDRTQGAFPKSTHLNPGSHIELPFRCFAPERHRWTQMLFHVVGNYKRGTTLCPTCRELEAT
jgi:hypothetical protein